MPPISSGAFLIKILGDGKLNLRDAWRFAKKLLSKNFRNTMIDGAKGLENVPKELFDVDKEDLTDLAEAIKECAEPMADALHRGTELAAAPEIHYSDDDA